MKKRFQNALIMSIVLYGIAFALVWYNDNFDEALSLTKEYWWFIVLLPIFLMVYSWFKGVKKKAFDMGAGVKRDEDGKIIN